MVMSPLRRPSASTIGRLLDAVVGERSLCLFEGRADFGGDEILARHALLNRNAVVGDKADVSVC